MEYILMQSSNDAISSEAAKILQNRGLCQFDTSESGARLQPVSFGSR